MDTIDTTTPTLDWVTAAGGPELSHDGGCVSGLPEDGWWVWPDAKHKDQAAGLELNIHRKWIEPVTGTGGELLVSLWPEEGVRWSASFMAGGRGQEKWPARASGVAANFDAARESALAWRPSVQVIDGIECWTDPASGNGEAVGLTSGELTWRPGAAKGSLILWRFEPVGLAEVMQACDHWSSSITGACDTLEQMLAEVDAARERIRTAMRKFLLNF